MPANDDLQALLDERAIREVLARYCRGVDRLDEELIRSCYHEGSTDDHGVWKGPGREFAAFVVRVLREHAVATQHVLGQSIVELAGDAACAETYVIAHHRVERGDDTLLETVGGRYVDRLSRKAGEWRLDDRVVIVEWEKRERVERVFPAGAFREGLRSREDAAYSPHA